MSFKRQENMLFQTYESTALHLKLFIRYSVTNEQRFKFHLKAVPSELSLQVKQYLRAQL